MKKHYDEASVVRALAKKVRIDMANKMISVNTDSGQVGNGSWGKIDYLCHYCGYRWHRDRNAAISTGASDKPSKRRKKAITEETEREVKFNKKKANG